jgi:hypothetical protein
MGKSRPSPLRVALCAALSAGCGSDWSGAGYSPNDGPESCAATQDELASSPPAGAGCAPAFASGVNVAWLSFASDVPAPRLCDFRALFASVAAAGGPVVRWWLHTDGSRTPGYDAGGMAQPITDELVADVRAVLDVARVSGVMLTVSLWSFDMLRQGPHEENRLLLTSDAHRQAYLDNVLTPLVRALAGHPALYAWEAFNEPEGMSDEFGWTGSTVPMQAIQTTVNWLGDAVHAADPSARFTNGCWSFPACSEVGSFKNYYSDAELLRAGGRALGTLDFYQVHYYTHNGPLASPFVHPASYWNLDKPIVIGEFHATESDGVAPDELFTHLHDTGYAGAWAWQYANADGGSGGQVLDFRWPSMQQGLEHLRDQAHASVELRCE